MVIVLGILNITEHLGWNVWYIDSFWAKWQFMHHQLNCLPEALGIEPLRVEFCAGLKGRFIPRQSRQGMSHSIVLTFLVEDFDIEFSVSADELHQTTIWGCCQPVQIGQRHVVSVDSDLSTQQNVVELGLLLDLSSQCLQLGCTVVFLCIISGLRCEVDRMQVVLVQIVWAFISL